MADKKFIFFALFTLCFLAFARTLFYPFVHDDFILIKHNPAIGDLSNIPGIFLQTFSLENISRTNPYYRPILEIFYRLQYRIFSFNPLGYHLTNLLFHFLNSILVFSLLNQITKRTKLAGAIALLFALHPVQTEAVACVSGISNLFYSSFCLSSILLYIRAFRKEKPTPDWFSLLGALIFFGIAVLGKEQAVVMPLALVLYDLCFAGHRKETRTGRLLGKGLFFFSAIQYLIWRKVLLGSALVPWPVVHRELLLRVLTVPKILLTYLQLTLFPQELHYYRNINLLDPAWIAALVFLLIIISLFLLIRIMPKERARLVIFGLGWFLIFLLPVINIVPIIIEYSFVAVFEHFLYLPLLGILLACFTLGEFFIKKITSASQTNILSPALVGILVMLCFALSVRQNTYWRGEIPLFERTVKYEKEFGRGHVLLGRAHTKQGNYAKAISAFQKALVIFEKYHALLKSPSAKNLYSGLIQNVQKDIAICHKNLQK